MNPLFTVYASIGNSDDTLSQKLWSDYADEFVTEITEAAGEIFGVWFSESSSRYQNACVAFEVDRETADKVRATLTELRKQYNQESIAWAEVHETQFI